MYDIAFISYNEKEAEKNWKILVGKFPYAKRTHGVKGIHQAHIAAIGPSINTNSIWIS